MPEVNQTIIEVSDSAEADGSPGHRNDVSLKAAFPSSPIYEGGLLYAGVNETVKTTFATLVQEGVVLSGFGVSSYNRDWTLNTNWVYGADPTGMIPGSTNGLGATSTAAGDGNPATNYVPNVNSPYPKVDYTGQPMPTEEQKNVLMTDAGIEYGGGTPAEGTTAPETTATVIETQIITSPLTMGSSGA